MVALTIGMTASNEFDGVSFTRRAPRLHHDLDAVELLGVDNDGRPTTRNFVQSWTNGRYLLAAASPGAARPGPAPSG